MILYKCCEHCEGDPENHKEKGPDWHEYFCTLEGCITGRQSVASE